LLFSPCPWSPFGEQSYTALLCTAAVAVPAQMSPVAGNSTGRCHLAAIRGYGWAFTLTFHGVALTSSQNEGDPPEFAKGEPPSLPGDPSCRLCPTRNKR